MKKRTRLLALALCLMLSAFPAAAEETEALETPEEIVAMAEPEAAQEDVLLGEGEEAALPNGADVPLDADHFPDANFRQYLADNWDGDHNGALSETELGEIRNLVISNLNIADLTGIEQLTYLTELHIRGSQITTLDLTGCTNLTEASFEHGSLKSIKVAGLSGLKSLSVVGNQLESLDLTGCSSLKHLNIAGNGFDSLDLAGLPVDPANCTFQDGTLTSDDFWVFVGYGKFKLTYNGVTLYESLGDPTPSSDPSTPTNLPDVKLNSKNFPDAKLRKQLSQEYDKDKDGVLSGTERWAITHLKVRRKGIKNMAGIQLLENLQELDCYANKLTKLDVSKCARLRWLECSENKLTKLNVAGCAELCWLYCGSNQLKALDVTKCPALNALGCSNNPLKALDVTQCAKLQTLNCEWTGLKSLDLTQSSALEELDLGCTLRNIRLPALPGLKRLSFGVGRIKSFNFDDLSGLEELRITEAYIRSLKLSAFGVDPDQPITLKTDKYDESMTILSCTKKNGQPFRLYFDIGMTVTIDGKPAYDNVISVIEDMNYYIPKGKTFRFTYGNKKVKKIRVSAPKALKVSGNAITVKKKVARKAAYLTLSNGKTIRFWICSF